MTHDAEPSPRASACSRSARSARACATSSPTSRSRRSATSRTRACCTPQRTRGGYRLFGEDDVERLETILRLQRDEFLPLRVIREELDSPAARPERTRRRAPGLRRGEDEIDLAGALRAGRASRPSSRGARGLRAAARRGSTAASGSTARATPTSPPRAASSRASASTPATCARSARPPTAQAALLEQLVAPALRSRNPERRKAGARRPARSLAGVAQELRSCSSGATCATSPTADLSSSASDLPIRTAWCTTP